MRYPGLLSRFLQASSVDQGGGSRGESVIDQRTEIDLRRSELLAFVGKHQDKPLTDPEIVGMSQELDTLIVQYMKRKKRG